MLNSDLKVLSANPSFYDTFKVTPNETLGNFTDMKRISEEFSGFEKLLLVGILKSNEKLSFANYRINCCAGLALDLNMDPSLHVNAIYKNWSFMEL